MQWFRRSWSHPYDIDVVELIYEQACFRERSHDRASLVVDFHMGEWAKIEVIQAMRSWVRGMTAAKFAAGSLIDKFVWTYSVYMMAGYSNVGVKAWLNQAIQDTEVWLRTAIYVLHGIEPSEADTSARQEIHPELWEMRFELVR